VDIDQLEQKSTWYPIAPWRNLRVARTELEYHGCQPTAEIFAARRGLLLSVAIGTGVKKVLLVAIAAILVVGHCVPRGSIKGQCENLVKV